MIFQSIINARRQAEEEMGILRETMRLRAECRAAEARGEHYQGGLICWCGSWHPMTTAGSGIKPRPVR